MIKPGRYAFKSFEADALQVTPETIQDVAEWCGGVVRNSGDYMPGSNRQFIDFIQTTPSSQSRASAYEGDWIVKVGDFFREIDHTDFSEEFEPIAEDRRKELEEYIGRMLSADPDFLIGREGEVIEFWVGKLERLFKHG